MTKKRKDQNHHIEGMLEKLNDLLSQMSPEEKEMLMEMTFGSNHKEIENAMFYRYEAPDYDVRPIADWLVPLLDVDGYWQVESSCEEAVKSGKGLSLEQKREDIKNLFYVCFKEFEPSDDIEEEDENNYGDMTLASALRLMEMLNIEGCEDVVLESLRQESHFLSYYLSGCEEYMVYALFRMCKDKTDLLLDFMKEDGLLPYGKPVIFDTLVMIYLYSPKNRLKACAAITNYLNYCYKICKEGADPANIDSYAYSLATAHVREALPVLKKMYRDIDIPEIEVEGYDDIEEIMDSDDITFRYDYTTIKELLEDRPEDDVFEDEYDDDIEEGLPSGESMLCNPDSKPKKYTLRIAMLDSLEPVERTITAPSTMYLNHLASIVMMALGHDGLSDENYYFMDKDDETYHSTHTSLDDFGMSELTEETTIEEVLAKKNSSILLAIISGHYDEWHISVMLESPKGKYKEDSNPDVKLISGYGAYPPASCDTHSAYEELFSKKKLKEPDFKVAQKKIDDYLTTYL